MKQVAQNYRSGELRVLDVPTPACKPGGVLVRSLFSLISTGTETMKVSEARLSLVGKARARPDQVRKVLDSVAQQGASTTYKKVMSRLDSFTPLGYSLCGVVEQVGAGAEEFSLGQVVVAAGNEFALHAEVNWVPVNLCVPVPAGVAPEHAAFSTVGAIAMHGVRRSEAQLGDTACVVGLGLVGQLVVRLLVAAGVRVVGLDVVDERCRAAEKAGALLCAAPDESGIEAVAHALATVGGVAGADHVFLVAGGSSSGPVEAAARLARDRARVVDIGKCRLDLPWNAYYDKELDLRLSRSYGPGRYDDTYEIQGIDYPVGYVRWTERRNLACFLDLIARGEVDVSSLVSGVFPVEHAEDVYSQLNAGTLRGVGFLFEYPASTLPARATGLGTPSVPVPRTPRRAPQQTGVRVGFIGAGNYATSMLLPHLARHDAVQLASVATTTSLSAVNAQRRFGFTSAVTDPSAILEDESVDAVFVVTRHHSHAELVCRALECGKTVFVEKPLALTHEQLNRVLDTVAATGNDRVMVGFNRRFAPLFTELKREFGRPVGATSARYLVNAGALDAKSWYRNEELEGSRFTGEGGHFIDSLSWWMGSLPQEVMAMAGADPQDLQILLRFADGSTGTITYIASGHPRFPKETFDAGAGGHSARLDNFKKATLWAGRRQRTRRTRGGQDKGQRAQLELFVDAVRSGGPMPIALESLVATTKATLAVSESLLTGRPERV